MKFVNDFVDRFLGPAVDVKIARCLVQMAEIGRDAAQVLKESKCKNIRVIERYESASDAVENEIHVHLDSAFQLRYFDDRDVEHVSSELDNTIDRMQSVAKHVSDFHTLFEPVEFPREAEQMLDIIVEMTEIVHKLMIRIENRHLPIDEISKMVDALDQDESEADRLYRTARAMLITKYLPNGNAMEFFAWDAFYKIMEQVTDNSLRVGRIVLSIARK